MVSPTGLVSYALPQAQRQILGVTTIARPSDVAAGRASDHCLRRSPERALCARSPEMLITVAANDAMTLSRLRSVLGAETVDFDRSERGREKRIAATASASHFQ